MNLRDPGAEAFPPLEALVLAFGPFRLYGAPARLLRGEEEVRLGGRALALLRALASSPGAVLSRGELEARVWPNSVVEDSSLRVHVAALRRALGDGVDGARYIANVPGRGYSFVAAVSQTGAAVPAPAVTDDVDRVDRLPAGLTRLIGREAVTAALCAELARRRLLSIVGHGGIGKTSLALAAAERMRQDFPAGVCFVDLAPVTAPEQVIEAVASSLGLPLPSGANLVQLEAWLRPRRLLLILDNCEHLIEDVAVLVERVLKHAPGLVILATSREPLDVDGEWVHRILPLEVPPEGVGIDCAAALRFSAVELLAERAAASLDSFTVDAHNVHLAAGLCRRLDGVPLAIEFAASRIGLLGLEGVCAQLEDRLRLLGSGRRTALPRHRTLRALLDWSYHLLDQRQQDVLRHCGVFKGGFSLEAVVAVVADQRLPAAAARDCLLELAAKSLVRVELAQVQPIYSLLEITRAYALEQLVGDHERQQVSRRHAAFMLDLVKRGALQWTAASSRQWFRSYTSQAGNFRAALDWCFGPEGELALGIELLATDFHPMTLFLGETEFIGRGRKALDAIAAGVAVAPILGARISSMLRYMSPLEADRGDAALSRLRWLAEQDEDALTQLEALYQLHWHHFVDGDYRSSEGCALRSEAVAGRCGEPAMLHARRLRALSAHYRGDHAGASAYAGTLLAAGQPPMPARLFSWTPSRLSLQIMMARILWMQGQGGRATELALACTRQAKEEPFPPAYSQALCLAALPVALWQGDDALARALLGELDEHLLRHPQVYWHPWAGHLRQVLTLRAAPALPTAVLSDATDAKMLDHLVSFGAWGYHAQALRRWREGLVGWTGPELLRIEGELLLQGATRAPGAAEAKFLQALELAVRQGAHAWGLRAANSLARLQLSLGREAEAAALLGPWLGSLDAMGGSVDAAGTRLLMKGRGSPC